MTWRERAECRPGNGVDPRIFFENGTRDQALAVCARCPVRHQCHLEALRIRATDTRPLYGIWGGSVER